MAHWQAGEWIKSVLKRTPGVENASVVLTKRKASFKRTMRYVCDTCHRAGESQKSNARSDKLDIPAADETSEWIRDTDVMTYDGVKTLEAGKIGEAKTGDACREERSARGGARSRQRTRANTMTRASRKAHVSQEGSVERPSMIRECWANPTRRNARYASAAPTLYAVERVEATELPLGSNRPRTSCALARQCESWKPSAKRSARRQSRSKSIGPRGASAIKAGASTQAQFSEETTTPTGKGQTNKRRWARNYLRHCATTYEEQLAALFGVVGKKRLRADLLRVEGSSNGSQSGG